MATLVRWQPFQELAALQSEMSRLLNGATGGSNGPVGGQGQSWIPAVDVWETENEVVYAFDLPGIPEDSIAVEYEDGALTVSAERTRSEEVSGERFHRFERRYGQFSRTIGLPQGVKEEAIKASYEHGVLEIHVPKPEQPKPRRIQIGSAEQGTIEGSKA